VKKTHRVIIVEECMRSGGIGASVSSWISENLLEELDHEVIRLSSQDVPTAYAKLLEDGACAARMRAYACVCVY
jgi:pyruvate dehydrogenase E1 component beta subunit